MKPTDAQLRKAIRKSIDRWQPTRDAETLNKMGEILCRSDCPLCIVYTSHCGNCFFNDSPNTTICSREFIGWSMAREEGNLHKARYNATLLIKRLRKELDKLK